MPLEPQRTLHGQALTRTAVAAAAAAFLFAGVSLYWALGGTAGLSTLGGRIEELARSGDPTMTALNWASAVLKAAVGLMALALLRDQNDRPQRLLLLGAGLTSVVLIAYGLLQTIGVALVATDVVTPARPPSDLATRWRLFLWEPWFLVWGLLLGAATWLRMRDSRADHRLIEPADMSGPVSRLAPRQARLRTFPRRPWSRGIKP
jgi:hypothetical protein